MEVARAAVYGEADAGRIWNRTLVRQLVVQQSFTQSEFDPCYFFKQLADGSFERDDTYWAMVRIEQIRVREKSYVALVIKYLQELAGLKGGMNGDGAELPGDVKAEVEALVRGAGWL